ncbi:DUF7544 domain-containing protein [Halorubrum ezzemoulense]|uniref:DUF7544 domain-containing protein n=1 Tax=Halorubrum ezzemoulense TaxID=337243 RepID=UPI00232DC1E2|nr:hypothetical protein [Halorubrum ezzemoulense]MDB2240969.1 hypothetical protein [Halorubrum ezzemoulense]
MSWHAVDAVDRAVDATRRLLFPFEAVRWAKLAALAAGMAGGGAAASHVGASSLGASTAGLVGWATSTSTGVGAGPVGIGRIVGPAAERVAGLDDALLVAAAVGGLVAAFALVTCSVAFRLAFYDALATTEVALWRPFRTRFRQAFGLSAVVTAGAVVAAIPAAAFAVVAADSAVSGAAGVEVGGVSGASEVAFVALGVTAGGVALIGTVGSRLTLELVAPAMVARDVGVLAGWRTVWASLRESLSDVAVYLAVHAVVAASAGIVRAVAVASVGGVVAAVGLVVLVLAAVPLGGVAALVETTAGAIVLATVLLCAVAAVAVLTLPVLIVARTYLTAYEVSTLAGLAPGLAPLAPTLVASDDSEPADGGPV